jgi:hypothetical protein
MKRILSLLMVLMICATMLAGCGANNNTSEPGSSSVENTEPKSIKITDMGTVGQNGFVVGVFSTMPTEGEPVTEINGFGFSVNGEATIELKEGDAQTGSAWTGTGSYFVNAIDIDTGGLFYLYMDGQERPNETYSNVPKLDFNDTVTTVSLDKFASAAE